MGAFLKIFIAIMCMSIILSISLPSEETQFIKDNFFTKLLGETTNQDTGETYYSELNSDTNPLWSEGGNQDSNFLTKFLDGLSIIKTFAITLLNIAVLPITAAIRMDMPAVVRLMVFIPLALIYILSGAMTIVRGVNP